jgi:predicted AAA+ superfamily ATPase
MVAIAARSGELLNYSSVAQDVGVSIDTIKRWTGILQTSGIVYLLQPYSNNHLKRAIKTPKIYMLDTGLMAWLTKWLTPETIQQGAKNGQFFESFVVSEIIKSFYNQGMEPPIYFYRDTNQKEIDLLIEYDKTIYPIEIKITANPTKKMAKAFELLQQLPHNELSIAHGTIINQYPQKLWLAENLVALPITYL